MPPNIDAIPKKYLTNWELSSIVSLNLTKKNNLNKKDLEVKRK